MDNIYKLNSFYLLYIIVGSLSIFFYKADSRSHIERSRNVRPFDYRTFAIQQQQQKQHFNFNHPQTAKSLLMYKTKGPIYFGTAAVPMFFYDKLLAMPRFKKYSYGNILRYGEKQRKSISPTRDIVVPYNLVKNFNTNINPKYIPVQPKNMGPFFRTKSMYDEMPSSNLRGDTIVKMIPQCNQNGLTRSGICSTTETPRSPKLYSDTTQSKLLLNSRFIEKNNEIISTESNFKEQHNASPSNQQFSYQLTPPIQPYSAHSYFTLDDVIIPSTYSTYHYNRSQIPDFNNNLPILRKKEPTSTEEPFTFLDFFSNVESIRKITTTTTPTSTTTQSIPIQKFTEFNIIATQATLVDPFERKPQTTPFTNLNIDDFYEYKDFQSNWIPKTTKNPRIPETTTIITTILPTNTLANLITTNSNSDILPFTDLPTSTKETPIVTTIATRIKKTSSIQSMERPEFRQRLRTKFQETYQKKQRDKSLSSIRNNVPTSQTTNNTLPSVKVTKRKYQRNSKLSRLKFPRKETFTIDNPTIGKSKRPKSINTNATDTKYSRIRSIFTVDAKNKTDSLQLLNDLRSSDQIKKNDTLASDIQTTTTTTTTTMTLRPTRKFSKRRQFSTTTSPTRDMREVLQSRKKSGTITTDLPPLPILKKPTVKENLTTEKSIPEVKRPIQINSKITRKPTRSESAIMTITSNNHDNNSEKSSTSTSKKFRKFTNNPIYRNGSSITEVPPLPIEVYFRKTNQAEI